MKPSLIMALAAVTGLVTACTSEISAVQPAPQTPAAAPTVEPAAGPREVTVTYTPSNGLPFAQRMANAYCTQHFGVATAQLVSDSPGLATFNCPGM